jgi:tetratricopeptide (TPR) repeat protein
MAKAESGNGSAGGGAGDAAQADTLPGAAFADALKAASAAAPHAAKLLGIVAYLAPRRIPLDIVTPDVMAAGERATAAAALVAAGLGQTTESDDGAPSIDIGAWVQAGMRDQLTRSGEDGGYAALVTRLVADAYPHGERDPGDADSWVTCQRLDEHVRAVLQFAPDDGEGAASTSQLLHQYSQYLFARGKFDDAEPVMRRAGAIAEALLGASHPRVGQDSADLAILLYESGRVEEALPFIRRAMAVDEAAFGPEHPVVAERYNILATLLETLGRPAEADPFIRHAVLAAEKTLGPDHPDTRLYRENYDKVIAAMDVVARRDDAVEAGTIPASPERLARPDIPPPPVREKTSLLGRLRRRGQ